MTKKPSWLFAAAGAIVAQGLVCAMFHRYGHIGGEGPDFWGAAGLATELPGVVVGERLFGVRSPMVEVLGFISGAAQFFLLFWAAIAVFRKFFGFISAEPGALMAARRSRLAIRASVAGRHR